MTLREEVGGGGKTYHRWGGGPKPFLGRGFMVCFPPLSFPPPFVFREGGNRDLGNGVFSGRQF